MSDEELLARLVAERERRMEGWRVPGMDEHRKTAPELRAELARFRPVLT